METKINIAAILKDKPQGTKLYSSACGKCELKEADDKSFKVSFYSSKFGFMNGGEGTFDKNGNLYDDGECIIFPSKEMRNWYKFDWKKGDVLVGVGQRVIFEKFIDENYTKKISLTSAAKALGFNYYNLSRLFSRYLNISFTEYVNSKRLLLAYTLICSSNKTILEIMYATGYTSERTFYRCFKDYFNMTPMQLRNINKY